MTEEQLRTYFQNRAMHRGFKLIADALNDAGKDMRVVLKPHVEIPWTKDSVKEHLFKPIMELMTSKQHTRELSKHGEISEIWETTMRFLLQNEHLDEFIPFPVDEEKQLNKLK